MKLEIGQWVVLKNGKVLKIMSDDMMDVKAEQIDRYATKEEILENGGCPIDLELRMYFFVPYNISPIQQGIQAGHCLGEHALRYGRFNPVHIVWDFLEKWKTFMIYNGGTTNSKRDFELVSVGSLNQIVDQLIENEIEISYFIEPDLNDALSAVCFIADERVFNKKDYPDFIDVLLDQQVKWDKAVLKRFTMEEYIEKFPKEYKVWVETLGGEKNVFLRELLRHKKFA